MTPGEKILEEIVKQGMVRAENPDDVLIWNHNAPDQIDAVISESQRAIGASKISDGELIAHRGPTSDWIPRDRDYNFVSVATSIFSIGAAFGAMFAIVVYFAL